MCKVKRLYRVIMNISDRVNISELFEEYGLLLTEKQYNMLQLYCFMDLSLNEISEQTGISRQGVRDHILHAVTALENYEEKLSVVEFKRKLSALAYKEGEANEILSDIRKLLEE